MNRTFCLLLPFVALVVMACAAGSPGQPRPVLNDAVSYSNDIRQIVQNYCTTCHAGDDPEGGFVLTSYETVREQVEHGELLSRINDPDDPMPEAGLLPAHLRVLFRKWADTGYRKQGGSEVRAPRASAPRQLPEIEPLHVGAHGREFLRQMQGHWVGSMTLMGREFEWFGFDYRAIAPSHVHGIFEGGTVGNLFTSFFIADYRGTRTLMARNGGLLNGIYRTSYFVLDQAGSGRYRFVDAVGGPDIMWMELAFHGDELEFTSYTSRFGLTAPPDLHMRFRGRRLHEELAAAAAKAVGFPSDDVHLALPDGLPRPDWGAHGPAVSASYLWEGGTDDVVELAKLSGDPYRIDEVPHLATLALRVNRGPDVRKAKLLVYLSREALTDARGQFVTEWGYVRKDLADGILLFPEIAASGEVFTFTYLHPGSYYLTVVADTNGDGYPSPGDVTCPSRVVKVTPESHQEVVVDDVRIRN